MRATSLLPHPALRPYVARYLGVDAAFPAPVEQRVSPWIGPVLVVLLEGTQQAGVVGGALERMPPAYLIGRLDRAALNVFGGQLRSFMIQFTATGVYRLLGLPIRELVNLSAEIGALAGVELRNWACSLAELPDHAARAAATDRVLRARLSVSSLSPHASRALEAATTVCTLMTQARGRVRVETLAQQLNCSPRTLLRHFEEAVGLPVRSAARVVRFLSARAHLDRHPAVSWTDVAFRFGYADQSHLIRDFQRYCGEPPSVYRAKQHEARLITLVSHDALGDRDGEEQRGQS